jgi:dihydrolipoamide dehydrogenase
MTDASPYGEARGPMDGFDVVVVGGGPGGYVAAIRAAQLKLRTALIERDTVGGVCLNWGCIPSKTLLRSAEILDLFRRADEFGFRVEIQQADLEPAINRSRQVVARTVEGVRFLLRKNGVEVLQGSGFLAAPNEIELRATNETQRLRADNVILATGCSPRRLPGLAVDGIRVLTSREALELPHTPSSIVIIGGGAVGCEFAYLYRSYGAEVTLVEQLPHLLPAEDAEISTALERSFKKRGIAVTTGARVVELSPDADGVAVRLVEDGRERTLRAERVLVGIGVRGNSDGLGLEAAGVRTEQSYVCADAHQATNVPHVYAVGDLTGPPMLAHVASAQGVTAVETIAGLAPAPLVAERMPRATYCQPEVGSVGLTESEARVQYGSVGVGRFPFRANGRAVAIGEPEGFVKVISDTTTDAILGVHMIGHGVTELIAEASLAIETGTTSAQLGHLVHAHPTLSESLKEAALATRGGAIHSWQLN